MFEIKYIVLFAILVVWLFFVWEYFLSRMQSLLWFKWPYVNSFNSQLNLLKKHLRLKPSKALLDLGCGDGKAMRFFAKYYPIQVIDGYDTSLFAIALGRFYNHFFQFKKRINLMHWDLHNADLSQYDYVYVYLLPKHNELIEDWLFDGIKDDCVVISNSFTFKKHKEFAKIEDEDSKWKFYLYRKN